MNEGEGGSKKRSCNST